MRDELDVEQDDQWHGEQIENFGELPTVPPPAD
jgi:hypothetical protein